MKPETPPAEVEAVLKALIQLSNEPWFKDMKPIDLFGANLRGARVTGANLVNADLSEADFFGASFRGADMKGARLQGTVLRGAGLSDALNLTSEQLAEAIIDSTTILPPGVRMPTRAAE